MNSPQYNYGVYEFPFSSFEEFRKSIQDRRDCFTQRDFQEIKQYFEDLRTQSELGHLDGVTAIALDLLSFSYVNLDKREVSHE